MTTPETGGSYGGAVSSGGEGFACDRRRAANTPAMIAPAAMTRKIADSAHGSAFDLRRGSGNGGPVMIAAVGAVMIGVTGGGVIGGCVIGAGVGVDARITIGRASGAVSGEVLSALRRSRSSSRAFA